MSIGSNILFNLRQKLADYRPVNVAKSYREAAVLVAITPVGDELEVVLTRRAQHLKLHPGEAAFPGGKKEPNDSSLLMTALREANEEVGLIPETFELLGGLDQRVTRSDFKVTPFVGLIPNSQSLIANHNELDCIYTVPLNFFLDPQNLIVNQLEYQGQLRYVARFNYHQHTIWGTTATIIVDLMNIAFDAGIELDKSKKY